MDQRSYQVMARMRQMDRIAEAERNRRSRVTTRRGRGGSQLRLMRLQRHTPFGVRTRTTLIRSGS